MAEMEERELLLRSLKGYLTDLLDGGVDELAYAADTAVAGTEAGLLTTPAAPMVELPPQSPAASGEMPAVSQPLPAASQEAACLQEGNPHPRLLFVLAGRGFASEAGALLGRIIAGMKLKKEEVGLLSFEPGQDPAAVKACLTGKITALAPEVVVTMGEEASFLLLGDGTSLERLRGRFRRLEQRHVMPTLHPEALLADEALKRHVWEDMKQVMRRLGIAT